VWISFVIAVATTLVLLYVPGYIFVQGLMRDRLVSLCCAPLVPICAYATLPIAYYRLGIPCSQGTILIPTLAAAILSYLLGRRVVKGTDAPSVSIKSLLIPLAYVLVATIVCGLVFVNNLPTPEAFYSRYDNITHLNTIQAFVDSGRWSSLHHSPYLASTPSQTPTGSTEGGFYPCAWHDLCALVRICTGVSTAVSINAVIVVLTSTVFPLGMYLLLNALFDEDKILLALGAIVTSGFSVWPWVFIIKGPCYPNLLGNCLLPAVLGFVVLYVERHLIRNHLPSFASVCLASFAALALAHPNTLFTAYVFLAPYGAHVILRSISAHATTTARRAIASVCALGVYVTAIAGFWLLCYKLPMFASILSREWWDKSNPLGQTLASLALLRLDLVSEQVVMSVAMLAGAIVSIRNRQPWLIFPVAFFAICFVGSQVGWQIVKYWLGGMWYSTAYRFAANLCMLGIPLATAGFSSIYNMLSRKRDSDEAEVASAQHLATVRPATSRIRIAPVAFILLACMLNYWPTITLPAGIPGGDRTVHLSYGAMATRIHRIYDADTEHVLSTPEVEFVRKAYEITGPDALVVNSPNDGSMWAYGVTGINTYYRRHKQDNQTKESRIIATRLNDFAGSADVQWAVRKTDAKYVLLLDKDVVYEDGTWIPYYYKKQLPSWAGIDAVDDDTPGFDTVLADGDEMRLYRIKR